MSQQEFVGTWEQLSALAPQFQGQVLQLTVVSEPTPAKEAVCLNDEEMHKRLSALIEEAERLELEPGQVSADPDKAAYEAAIAEKYRKMGFLL